MTTNTTVKFDVTGTWERTAVSRHGDHLALMLTITASNTGASRNPTRMPVDLVLVLDRSGSMHGDKLELVKQAALEAVDHLGRGDAFSVVMFDDEVQVLMPLSAATDPNRDTLAVKLREVRAGSSTCLSGGWLTGCELLAEQMPAQAPSHLHRALLLTDGLANVGIIDPHQLMTHAGALRQRGVVTSTMGVGLGFDEVLLGGMAEAGGGNFAYVGSPAELPAFFRNEIGGLLDVIAPQPQLHITFPPGLRGTLVNQFPVNRIGNEFVISLADLHAGDVARIVFDVSSEPGEPGTTFQPQLAVDLPHRRDIALDFNTSMEPLTRTRAREAVRHEARPDVQQLAAQLRADRDHREAMRLDRAGRFDEARSFFAQARDALLAAPDSMEIRTELSEAQYLFDTVGQHGEHVRKERVHRAMHRSRGNHPSQ